MGSVFKLKSGKWAIRFDMPVGSGRRSQKQIGGFQKKSEAEKELTRIEAEILKGEFFRASTVTVSEFIEIWLADHVEPNLAPKTHEFYQGLYQSHFKSYFANIPLSELKGNHIDAFYAHLRESTSLCNNSIHHCHKMLRAALNKAVKWDYIKVSPMRNVTTPKQDKTEMKHWDEDDIFLSEKVFKGTLIEWHVKVALLSGLREGEICALNVKYMNYKNHTFQIAETVQRIRGKGIIFKAPKTEKSKAILPMTAQLERLFRKRQQQINENRLLLGEKYNNEYSGYLSVWYNGNILEPNYIGKEFHRILIEWNEKAEQEYDEYKAGIRSLRDVRTKIKIIRFHDLRHSCATWLISQGVDLKTIQEILRHADFSTTANIYSHISVEAKKAALDRLCLSD